MILYACTPPARRVSGSMVMPPRLHRAQVDARVAGRRGVDQLVERDAVRPGQREQQLERRPAGAGLQPRQRAHRDAGGRGQLGQRRSPRCWRSARSRGPDRGDASRRGLSMPPVCQIGNDVCQSRRVRRMVVTEVIDMDERLRRGGDRRRRRRAERGADAGAVAPVGAGDRRGRAAQRAGRRRARPPGPRGHAARPSCWRTGRAEVRGYGGQIDRPARSTGGAADGRRVRA